MKISSSAIYLSIITIVLSLGGSFTKPTKVKKLTRQGFQSFTQILGKREIRICKAEKFSFFLHAVCLHHRPAYKKIAIRSTTGEHTMNAKQANTFIKSHPGSQRRSLQLSADQNYADECCGTSKYGCNVDEIYEYCNYVPLPKLIALQRRKSS